MWWNIFKKSQVCGKCCDKLYICRGVVQAYESNYENWWRIPEKAAAFHHGGLPYADSPRLICHILNIAFISLKSWENRIILSFVTNSSTNLRIVQDWFIMLTLFLDKLLSEGWISFLTNLKQHHNLIGKIAVCCWGPGLWQNLIFTCVSKLWQWWFLRDHK